MSPSTATVAEATPAGANDAPTPVSAVVAVPTVVAVKATAAVEAVAHVWLPASAHVWPNTAPAAAS